MWLLALAASRALAFDVDVAWYDGHPYAFVNEWLTWEEADAVCASYGAHLAVVDDLDELRFLLRSVHFGPRFNDGNDSWLGAAEVGPFAGEYEPGLIFTYPWTMTLDSAFWMRPIDTAEHKAICERF